MTALSPSHGSKADFYLGTSGTPGTAIAITQYVDSTGLSFSRDKAEVSALKQLFKSFVAGMADATIPLQGPADTNIAGQMWNLFIMSGAGSAIQYQYAPGGFGTSGTALWTGFCFVSKYEEKAGTGTAYVWTGELQNSGQPVRTIQ